jgi:hypothetical protein
LPEQHPEAVAVMAAQRFFDALPMIVQIGDLIVAILNADPIRHLRSRLDDTGNFMQDR